MQGPPLHRDVLGQDAETDGLHRLTLAMDMVREMSLQTDPEALVNVFRTRSGRLFGDAGLLTLSRRGLDPPYFRVTRSSTWQEAINPWNQQDRLPLLRDGLLGELLYGDEARVIKDFRVANGDPAATFLQGARAILALPLFENGHALNMVIRYAANADAFDQIDLADWVLRSNLFGRATSSLVLKAQLEEAYRQLDRELLRVGEIQQSLLPEALPDIPGVDIAAWYKTAARAGGDYYDFFHIDEHRWGLLIADVSGHGTPAAVLMAILRTMLHATCSERACPAEILRFANKGLIEHTQRHGTMFVTAFYAIYDARTGRLTYSCAGHNPPLVVSAESEITELDKAQSVPLSVLPDAHYESTETTLRPGDTLILYTDGITEAHSPTGEMYGRDRLLSCVREDVRNAQHIIDCVTHKLMAWTGPVAAQDDRTLVAMRILKEPRS